MEPEESVTYLGVKVSHKGIKYVYEFPHPYIEKESITEIRLVEEKTAKRPLIVVIVGLAVILVGAIPLVGILKTFLYGGAFYIRTAIIPPCMFFIGGLLIYEAFRKCWFLYIETHNGQSRILLDGKVDPVELVEFVTIAKNEFAYNIKLSYPS